MQKGVSVIEIVIVTAISGMIVLLLTNLPNSLSLIGKSSHESLANQILSEKIESIRASGYAILADGTAPIIDSRLSQLTQASGDIIVEGCLPEVCTQSEEMKKVILNLYWHEQKGDRSISITTYISNGGLN